MKEIKIGMNEREQRLDRFLLKYFNNSSRTNVYKLIRKKVFKVNGVRVKEDYFLQDGDVIQVYLADESFEKLIKPIEEIQAEEVDLDIVYEDDELLIVNKPKGILTHPDKNEYKNTLSSKVQIYLRHLSSRTFKPASIQRLDKNTSGLVTFCKTYDSLKKYNEIMRNRGIKKYYLAVVHGQLKEPGELKGYLTKDEFRNKVTITKHQEDEQAKFVHTRYTPVKVYRAYTLVEIELLTGRTHQIRATLASIGHPIVGDGKYGGRQIKNVNSQLLHGYKLKINDKTIESEPKEINKFLEEIK